MDLSASTGSDLIMAVATGILVAAVISDLRSRKFPNSLFLFSTAASLITVIAVSGWAGLPSALLGFLAGVALMLPLVLAKMVGAGDLKLLAAFGILAGASATTNVAIYGMLWAGVFGLASVIFRGQIKTLWANLVAIVLLKQREGLKYHHIPLTVGFLFGWMSYRLAGALV
jgi:prepilin peptidase CpaA